MTKRSNYHIFPTVDIVVPKTMRMILFGHLFISLISKYKELLSSIFVKNYKRNPDKLTLDKQQFLSYEN
jgi:hypothetical protein